MARRLGSKRSSGQRSTRHAKIRKASSTSSTITTKQPPNSAPTPTTEATVSTNDEPSLGVADNADNDSDELVEESVPTGVVNTLEIQVDGAASVASSLTHKTMGYAASQKACAAKQGEVMEHMKKYLEHKGYSILKFPPKGASRENWFWMAMEERSWKPPENVGRDFITCYFQDKVSKAFSIIRHRNMVCAKGRYIRKLQHFPMAFFFGTCTADRLQH